MLVRAFRLLAPVALALLSVLIAASLRLTRPSAPGAAVVPVEPEPALLAPDALPVCQLVLCEVSDGTLEPGSDDWWAFATPLQLTVVPERAIYRTITVETLPIPLAVTQAILTFPQREDAVQALRATASAFPDAEPLGLAAAEGIRIDSPWYRDSDVEGTLAILQPGRHLVTLDIATLTAWQTTYHASILPSEPRLATAADFGSTPVQRAVMRETLLARALSTIGFVESPRAPESDERADRAALADSLPLCRLVPCSADPPSTTATRDTLAFLALPPGHSVATREEFVLLTPPLFRTIERLVVIYPDEEAATAAFTALANHPNRWPDQADQSGGTSGSPHRILLFSSGAASSSARLIARDGNRLLVFALHRDEATARQLLEAPNSGTAPLPVRDTEWRQRIDEPTRAVDELLAVVSELGSRIEPGS